MDHAVSRRIDTKVGLTLLVLALFGLVVGFATWAAFSDTTENSGNVFSAGTVDIDDNDSGTVALYDNYDGTPEAKPGDGDEGCIKVTFNGSLDSNVKLYSTSTLNANNLDDQLTLEVTSGSGEQTGCGDFTAAGSAGDVYSGSLADFMSTHSAYGGGLALNAGGDAVWSNGEATSYRFTVTLSDDADVNEANAGNVDDSGTGYSTGSHTFTWEARNV